MSTSLYACDFDDESDADRIKRLAKQYRLKLAPDIFTADHARYLFDLDAYGIVLADHGRVATFPKHHTVGMTHVGGIRPTQEELRLFNEMPQFVWDSNHRVWRRGEFAWTRPRKIRFLHTAWACRGIIDKENGRWENRPRCILL